MHHQPSHKRLQIDAMMKGNAEYRVMTLHRLAWCFHTSSLRMATFVGLSIVGAPERIAISASPSTKPPRPNRPESVLKEF
jgi:hypothetical protein